VETFDGVLESDFLEEIPSLSHSVVFLYFFALIAEEGFLISSCCSLQLCIQMLISFLLGIFIQKKIDYLMYSKFSFGIRHNRLNLTSRKTVFSCVKPKKNSRCFFLYCGWYCYYNGWFLYVKGHNADVG